MGINKQTNIKFFTAKLLALHGMNNTLILMFVAVASSSDTFGPPRDTELRSEAVAPLHPEPPTHEQKVNHVPNSRFTSALKNENLTAMILQYAMCAGEASAKLVADPTLGLAHLYHENRFVEEPGVEVTGAGTAQVNGCYRLRETRTTRDHPMAAAVPEG